MSSSGGRRGILRLFSGSILNQAILSAGNFIVGLVLIRLTSDAQYGTYVLILATIMLLGPLQAAFIQPGVAARLTHADGAARAALVGGLYRAQRRVLLIGSALLLSAVMLAWGLGLLGTPAALIAGAGAIAIAASLFREFFRIVQIAYRRPFDVLRGDTVYTVLLVLGALASARTPYPAAAAATALAIAAMVGGAVVARRLWRHEPWDLHSNPGVVREIASHGSWAAIGCGIHWTFTQGYGYLVAAVLDVAAVAGVNATRLTLVPVGILSNGISTLMLPTAYLWLNELGPRRLMRRLILIALGTATLTIGYAAVVWLLRDWIFLEVFRKSFVDRDRLFQLWALVFTLVSVRDEVIFLLIARNRFRRLAGLALACAVLALGCAYYYVHRMGAAGALVGMAIGEGANLIGVAVLSAWELRAPRRGTNEALGVPA